MSSHLCGCDPEANHRCERWPNCVIGRRPDEWGAYIVADYREHTMPSTEERIEAREQKQELTRPTNPRSTTGHTVDEVKAFRTRMFEESMSLIDKKGADYNRDQQNNGDTLFNLRVAEILGIVPSAEEGILVRLSDKFMRIISLMKPGREAAVKDESVLDTIRDAHNYLDYAALIWLRRRGQ